MISSAVWGTSCLVVLPGHTRFVAWRCAVRSPGTAAVPCEWSTGLALHCSSIFARLAGINGVACPHVLHAMMAQVSGSSETCGRALGTCVHSLIAWPAKRFFIYLRPTIHWGSQDAWQHRDPSWLGGRVRSHRTCDSTGAHLNREVRSGAIWHVTVPEPTSSGRRGPEPYDTWQCQSPPW
jgi:hypothetical protein